MGVVLGNHFSRWCSRGTLLNGWCLRRILLSVLRDTSAGGVLGGHYSAGSVLGSYYSMGSVLGTLFILSLYLTAHVTALPLLIHINRLCGLRIKIICGGLHLTNHAIEWCASPSMQ